LFALPLLIDFQSSVSTRSRSSALNSNVNVSLWPAGGNDSSELSRPQINTNAASPDSNDKSPVWRNDSMSNAEASTHITIISACMRSDASPTFVRTEVDVTSDERDNGVHYYLAEAQLIEAGYEEPFVHFDDREVPVFLAAAITDSVVASMTVPDPITDNPSEEP
jgi:hypothetical protein